MPFRYPVSLEVEGKNCIVIGGGTIATHKTRELVDAGAMPTVIAEGTTPELDAMEKEGLIRLERRPYAPGDLRGAFLAIGATDDPEVHALIYAEATRENVLVNCVDDVEHCDFAAPSVVRRGDLMVTISTGGKAPALAKRLRKDLSERFGGEYGELVRLLGEAREEVIPTRREIDFDTWAARWERALDDENELIGLVRGGEGERVKEIVRAHVRDEHIERVRRIDGEARPGGRGWVALVGAGPGDPSLITVRGKELLRAADVVVHDRLVHPDLIKDKTAVYAGKHGGAESTPQEEINALLVRLARKGRNVVRLKGGDPFVFGRGAEEAQALASAGIDFEVVPAPTSAIAALAYAGIPVTDRRVASSFAVVTGHSAQAEPDWRALVSAVDTIVVLMGMRRLEEIVARLIEGGADAEAAASVVENGTLTSQRVVVAPLGELAAEVRSAGLASPAVIVFGRAVELREEIAWFDATEQHAQAAPESGAKTSL